MSPTIKFATLENKEIEVTIEDAKLIALESVLVTRILSGELQPEDYAVPKGGKAINLALKYCKKFGAIKDSCSQRSEFEIKCKEVQAWVDDFISHITKDGLGMVHEFLAVSQFLAASRLFALTCQCIFDYLTFKDYGKFREAFAFQFLFPPYFSNIEIQNIEQVLEGLELPTLEEIHADFEDKIPFTSDELKLAESENKSVRVGGNLEYKTNKRWIEELLIKIEYIVRRLNSFKNLCIWMENTFSECRDESFAYLKKFFNDQSNVDIRELYSELSDSGATFHGHIMDDLLHNSKEIANPCTNYENIDLIRDEMNKIEIKLAGDANAQKKQAEEFTKFCRTKWQTYHSNQEDKIFPHLTCFLENRYQEIHCVLCSLRGWMSPLEVQSKFSKSNICEKPKFEHMKDQNEDQSEELVSQKLIAVEQIRADVVSSLMELQYLAVSTARQFIHRYVFFRELQIEMRKLLHNLLLKDEEILTFICKEKFNLYMRASELGTINFAENKEEFDRIMEETDQKFHGRSSDIEEAKKKYFLHYKKFHYAMVDETKRQMKLRLDVEKGSLDVEKGSMDVEEGRRKRKHTTS